MEDKCYHCLSPRTHFRTCLVTTKAREAFCTKNHGCHDHIHVDSTCSLSEYTIYAAATCQPFLPSHVDGKTEHEKWKMGTKTIDFKISYIMTNGNKTKPFVARKKMLTFLPPTALHVYRPFKVVHTVTTCTHTCYSPIVVLIKMKTKRK